MSNLPTSNRLMNNIIVKCWHCEERYEVSPGKTVTSNTMILDYLICPHCKTARNPKLWIGQDIAHMCKDCHRPFTKKYKARFQMCNMCYTRWYRLQKKQQCYHINNGENSN